MYLHLDPNVVQEFRDENDSSPPHGEDFGGKTGGGDGRGRRVEFNRELSPMNPENSYRHYLIHDILDVHENRVDGKVNVISSSGLNFISSSRLNIIIPSGLNFISSSRLNVISPSGLNVISPSRLSVVSPS